MDVELTKESRRVLKSIYDIYRTRRKAGQPKTSAIHFEDSPLDNSLEIDGLSDAKVDLDKAGYIELFVSGNFNLSEKTIIFMENYTKDAILKWIEFGTNFIP